MKNTNPAMDSDSPQLGDAWFARARPASEVLPAPVLAAARRAPGRPAGSSKESTTVRFDRDVLEAFRASGPGWQTRMNAALRDWLRDHSPA
ncbi:MAG: BrnA antitoxin family protein [Pseudomonadota bacterium]|nr:BrnA antitoxin family protein [Pseudomonadota bacterium]